MKFADLGLAEPIVRAVAAEGYTAPTSIQTKAIPVVLAGRDLLACAQTGTGKTAAFALPMLHRFQAKAEAGAGKPRIRGLILCPTRELAVQIGDSFKAYGKGLRLRYTTVFGGVSQFHQVRALQQGVEILIATPGRLMDLMGQGYVDLRAVEMLVLDEADRMLDMGFIPDIRKIVQRLPHDRQTLLFSATMPPDIRRLAETILRNAEQVQTAPVASNAPAITQSVYFVSTKNKPVLLARLLQAASMSRTIVFTRTKHRADKLVKDLLKAGIDAEAIHGNKSQNARMRALKAFKGQEPPVLVATDIASRGIDVDDVTHVVNYDMPNTPETYVHRIGRTARAGASGCAVSFCDHEERGELRAIERLTRTPIPVKTDHADLGSAPVSHETAPRRPAPAPGSSSQQRGGNRRQGGSGPARPQQHGSNPSKAKAVHPMQRSRSAEGGTPRSEGESANRGPEKRYAKKNRWGGSFQGSKQGRGKGPQRAR